MNFHIHRQQHSVFYTMLLKVLINKGVETISSLYPEGEAREMVYAFLEHHIGTKRHTHIVEPTYEVTQEAAEGALAAFERMAAGEPLQYVAGKADFYGREFRVTPDVLIPRPETEILCRTALDLLSVPGAEPKILDMCTGSGCIAWTLALERPGTEVVAVDISDGALEVASSQDFADEIKRTGAYAPAFVKADVLADVPAHGHFAKVFDVILSNPPYVMDKEKALMRTNVLDHEPHLALFVSDEDPLLFYRAVARWASRLLSSTGFGVVEINEAFGAETAQVFIDAGFPISRVLQDFSGRDRFVQFSR